MAYVIRYGPEKPQTDGAGHGKGKKLFILCAAVLAAILAVHYREHLLPGDPAVTASALDGMVRNLKTGQSVAEAITAFCREIIANAS